MKNRYISWNDFLKLKGFTRYIIGGRYLCLMCANPVEDRRKKDFCSEECKKAFKEKYWEEYLIKADNEYLRFVVFLRDKGLCSKCGRQCVSSRQEGLHWEAHHILAVKDGGGECDVENFVTLCTDCHKEETNAQRLS